MKKIDLAGQKIGRLTIKKEAGRDKRGELLWECECECGNTIIALSSNLRKANHTTSCGCYRKENAKNISVTHGQTGTPLYNVWAGMKRRCYQKKGKDYYLYGGRGISMCKEWKADFNAFFEWAKKTGYKKGLSIDRIDTNGDYSPKNCRWVTNKQQANNKRNNRLLTYKGETHTMKEWSEKIGLNYNTLHNRLRAGWPAERALTEGVNG